MNIEKAQRLLPKFLVDAPKVNDDDFVNIYFTNAKSPCFIKMIMHTHILYCRVNFIRINLICRK